MTREEALAYGSRVIDLGLNDETQAFCEMAIKSIEQTRWIPVSEKLPNHDEYIKNNGLFIVSDGNRNYFEWFDIYDTQRFGEPAMTGFRVDYVVTAWMSLPEEPYKPTDSEKE